MFLFCVTFLDIVLLVHSKFIATMVILSAMFHDPRHTSFFCGASHCAKLHRGGAKLDGKYKNILK